MLIPFIVVIPGMIAAVLVLQAAQLKAGGHPAGVTYNDSILLLMRDVFPNGVLGVALAGLLASFIAGMAANVSAFNTVFSYDLWQRYVKKNRPDDYYSGWAGGPPSAPPSWPSARRSSPRATAT
jgi:solute:Na+ symporter, SSS family